MLHVAVIQTVLDEHEEANAISVHVEGEDCLDRVAALAAGLRPCFTLMLFADATPDAVAWTYHDRLGELARAARMACA